MAKNEQPKGYKRRVFLINPRFQLFMLGYNIVISLVAIGVIWFANSHFFSDFYQKGEMLGLPKDHVFFQFIQMQQSDMNEWFMIVCLAMVGIMAVSGLLISHKVAGPLYRMRNHMRDVATGKTSGDLNFRKGDFFQELPPLYNAQKAFLTKGTKYVPASEDESDAA